MWNWFCKLFNYWIVGDKSKQLPANIEVQTLPVNTDELPSAAWVAMNPPTLPSFDNMKPSLYQALAKARQEALDPVLPESMEGAVDAGVNVVLPAAFKKALISKEDLILFGKTDVGEAIKERIDDEDWNTIKCFIIKRLNDEGIKASSSSSGSFVMCHTQDILKTIKDVSVLIEVEDKDLPQMNSVGVYR